MRVALAVFVSVGLLCVAWACGKSPASPSALPRANIKYIAFTIAGEWSASGVGSEVLHGVVTATGQYGSQGSATSGVFKYSITIGLQETGGVGAKVTGVNLTWSGPGGPFGTTHFDNPLLSSYNDRINAYGSAFTKTLAVSDNDPSHQAATRVEASFTFVDDNEHAGVADGGADVGGVNIPQPVIVSFAADQPVIDAGGSTNLRWTIANGGTATIDNGIGAVSATSGSIAVSPSANVTTYHLTVSNPGGSTTSEVSVEVASTPPVITLFTVDDPLVPLDSSTLLRWTIAHATGAGIDNGVGTVSPLSGTFRIYPPPLKEGTEKDPSPLYRLTATNARGTASATVKFALMPDVEYRLFAADHPEWGIPGDSRYHYDAGGYYHFDVMVTPWIPFRYVFWGARPGQKLGVGFTPQRAFPTRLKAQIYKRGVLYKEADSCPPNTYYVWVDGVF